MAYTKAELIKALDGVPDDELIYVGVRLDQEDIAVEITNVNVVEVEVNGDVIWDKEIAGEYDVDTAPVTVIWARGSYQ